MAWGHHAWYDGSSGGYPADYVRTSSPVRQLTDVAALASFLLEEDQGDLPSLLSRVFAEEGRRFSPLVTAPLADPALVQALDRLLSGETRPSYEREIQEELARWPIADHA